MRFFNYFLFFLLCSFNVKGQLNHYIYIQTENKQPFYVKLNEKLFSSSASGYVIIPKLINGSYKLGIGFPKNEWPAQNVDVSIKDNDEGFILKHFDSKVWGLFNLQTLNIQFATDISDISSPSITNKTDAFSNTLAEVTNTPSIRQENPVIELPPTNSTDTARPIVKEFLNEEAVRPNSQINQVFSVIDNSGRSIIYTISTETGIDSVRLFIPYDHYEEEQAKAVEATENTTSKTWGEIRASSRDSIQKSDSSSGTLQPTDHKIEQLINDQPVIKDVKVTDVNPDKNNGYTLTIINPECKAQATVEDISKLGKKMAASGTDDDRIAIAKKAFRSKCYTTEQLRNLCSLLSNDEGKYNFFDAAYSHVSDVGNFKDLQFQLTEEYYITRFKAMLR